ncbi:MAG: hypothetical protein D6744_11915 [Planctomycetota bacterium]|nr:MAG: hypothetical protein D6744_11915 [Planctomycetota bacterium]
MMRKSARAAALLTVAALACAAGCAGALIANLVEEAQGSVIVQIINNTPFRASFSYGAFDDLDRNPPGPVSLQQIRLEAFTSSAEVTLTCGRDVAIATQKLVDRVIATNGDSAAGFDVDAFDDVVHFSAAPADSDGAALPDAGTAEGIIVRLGNDYSCGDTLIFTLEEDAAKPGGFRIDFTVIPDIEDDARTS